MLKITLQFKAFNYKHLDNLLMKILKRSCLLNLNITKPISLPLKKTLFTVLKSPHVNKKARNQFQLIIHKRVLVVYIKQNEIEKLKLFLNYLKSISSGVQIKIKYINNFYWKEKIN